jgi:hypothetical protein
MRKWRPLWLVWGSCLVAGCHDPAPVTKVASPLAEKQGHEGLMDSLNICYKPLPQKSPRAFREGQRLPFVQSTDTVINDERGLVLGPKFVLGSSYIQWDDQNRVSRLFVADARIKLSHGLHVGMPQLQVLRQLGWQGHLANQPDTLSLDSGFLDNGVDFVFRQGRLASVSLVNEAD